MREAAGKVQAFIKPPLREWEAVCIVGHVMLRGPRGRKRPRRSTAPLPPLREGGRGARAGRTTTRVPAPPGTAPAPTCPSRCL
jgi:hypothetical protein